MVGRSFTRLPQDAHGPCGGKNFREHRARWSDATQNHAEIAGYDSLHLAAVKPAKPDLRLRTPDALLPAALALACDIASADGAMLVTYKRLIDEGVMSEAQAEDIAARARGRIDEAVQFARESPYPRPEEALEKVFV